MEFGCSVEGTTNGHTMVAVSVLWQLSFIWLLKHMTGWISIFSSWFWIIVRQMEYIHCIAGAASDHTMVEISIFLLNTRLKKSHIFSFFGLVLDFVTNGIWSLYRRHNQWPYYGRCQYFLATILLLVAKIYGVINLPFFFGVVLGFLMTIGIWPLYWRHHRQPLYCRYRRLSETKLHLVATTYGGINPTIFRTVLGFPTTIGILVIV